MRSLDKRSARSLGVEPLARSAASQSLPRRGRLDLASLVEGGGTRRKPRDGGSRCGERTKNDARCFYYGCDSFRLAFGEPPSSRGRLCLAALRAGGFNSRTMQADWNQSEEEPLYSCVSMIVGSNNEDILKTLVQAFHKRMRPTDFIHPAFVSPLSFLPVFVQKQRQKACR
jgi:hypothetical protein